MSKPRILKTHTIINEHISTWNTTIETVLDEFTDKPVYWICKRSDDSDSAPGRSDPPRIKIRANAHHSPSIAGVRFDYNGTKTDRSNFCAVVAKHPEEVTMRKWTNVAHKKFKLGELFADVLGRGEEWSFRFDGEWFVWKETYSARLGACKCHNRDFKLLDDRDRLLAVYIDDHGRHRDTVGRLDYFVELDREEEVMSLAVIVGIQERKEQQKREDAETKRKREKYDRKHPPVHQSQVPFMPIH